MSNPPRISVIIPTFQRLDKLSRLLEEFNRQTYPLERIEVFVVDDGSPDDPGPELSRLSLNYSFRLLRLPPGGPAKARNRALELASGDYVLFLNDDVQLAPDLVQVHVETHQQLGEPISVLGTFCFTPEHRGDLFCRVLEDAGFTHTLQLRSGSFVGYRSFWTANLSVPRAAVEHVGRFDEDFREPCCEDLDLGYRLEQQLSMRVFYTDRAKCLHDHVHHPAQWRRRNLMVGRNGYLLYQKHAIGADLSGIMVDGRLSIDRVRGALDQLLAETPQMEQLQSLLEQVTERSRLGSPIQGQVSFAAGRVFELPGELEAMVAKALEVLTRYDQEKGMLEAILKRQELDEIPRS